MLKQNVDNTRYALNDNIDFEQQERGQYDVHEQHEMSFIVDSNTLVYPGTVMVILQNATVAYLTMVCPFRFGLPTFPAFRDRSLGDFDAFTIRPSHPSYILLFCP